MVSIRRSGYYHLGRWALIRPLFNLFSQKASGAMGIPIHPLLANPTPNTARLYHWRVEHPEINLAATS
jgi:hypothetical protein